MMKPDKEKNTFDDLQKNSEGFRLSGHPEEKIFKTPFVLNAHHLGEEYWEKVYYPLRSHLAELKELDKDIDGLDHLYWNEFREVYNKSFADGEAIYNHLVKQLELSLFPEYFSVVGYIKDQLFASGKDAEEIKLTDCLLRAMYTGDYLNFNNRSEIRLSESFPQAELIEVLENARKQLLPIYDTVLKIEIMVVIKNHRLHKIEETKPVAEIAAWEDLTGKEKRKIEAISKPGPKTPTALKEDIETILEDIYEDPKFLDEDGELIIQKAVEYAFKHPAFFRNWIDEENAKKRGGYSERRLHTLFSEQYKELKS